MLEGPAGEDSVSTLRGSPLITHDRVGPNIRSTVECVRMTPRITVLITAYQRQNYLRDAVRSVLASPVPRSDYEIVLVTDEIAPALADEFRGLGVKVLRVATIRGGEMWVAGLQAATGDVIAFLDDDDCFYPGKLSRVLEVFEDPDVIWYHHGYRRVDEERRPLPRTSANRSGIQVYSAPLNRHDLGRIRRAGGFYNNTCHAVRRIALTDHRNEFLEVTFGQDFAIPALLSGAGKVIIDPSNILSEFRTHWSQGSHPFGGTHLPESHLKFLAGIVRTFYHLSRVAPTEGAREFSRCRAESYEVLLWTTRGESISDPAGARRRALRALIGNLEERDFFHLAVLVNLLSLAPISRRVTEAVYTGYKRVEMRGLGLDVAG